MEYCLDMGMWNQVFAVPCVLADKHLKLAGREQLQVILWILRHGGERFSPETLAQSLGISQDSALDALEYWVQQGLLRAQDGALRPVSEAAAPAPAAGQELPGDPPASRELPPQKRMLRPDGEHVAARAAESADMRSLMQEAEMTLGKTLSPAMTALLVTITDDYGLPVEVTAMLLHYAAEVGRASTSYIDAVAREWAGAGILSVPAAEERLAALDKTRQAWRRVSAAAGLRQRSPSKSEGERALRWVEEWKFSDEMLCAAYDACAEHTGKFSAAYMDKVLSSWHQKGLRTPAQVEENRQARAQTEERDAPRSYDIEELAAMSSLDLPEEL